MSDYLQRLVRREAGLSLPAAPRPPHRPRFGPLGGGSEAPQWPREQESAALPSTERESRAGTPGDLEPLRAPGVPVVNEAGSARSPAATRLSVGGPPTAAPIPGEPEAEPRFEGPLAAGRPLDGGHLVALPEAASVAAVDGAGLSPPPPAERPLETAAVPPDAGGGLARMQQAGIGAASTGKPPSLGQELPGREAPPQAPNRPVYRPEFAIGPLVPRRAGTSEVAIPSRPAVPSKPPPIEVRIGRVELRAPEPAAPPAPPAEPRRGFDDQRLARSYLDRTWY
jgi:hypothetical protein